MGVEASKIEVVEAVHARTHLALVGRSQVLTHALKERIALVELVLALTRRA